eukprot:m.58795 g.58795  ORF g.58795 m.58795 type:complete len:204 (+) comp13532_c1_seq1:297-908(+)
MTEQNPICISIIGNAKAGKSSLQARIVDKAFPKAPLPFAEYRATKVSIPGRSDVYVKIGDLPSQGRFSTATAQFFRQSNAFLVLQSVADKPVDDEDPLDDVRGWLDEIQRCAFEHTPTIIVGSKSDVHERVLKADALSAVAAEHGMPYRELSAKTGDNVMHVFTEAVRLALSKPQRPRAMTLERRDEERARQEGKKCCQGAAA